MSKEYIIIACAALLMFAAGALGMFVDEARLPVPIYIILPDTTRLHLNSFNWRCTIEGATLEERSYSGSRSI